MTRSRAAALAPSTKAKPKPALENKGDEECEETEVIEEQVSPAYHEAFYNFLGTNGPAMDSDMEIEDYVKHLLVMVLLHALHFNKIHVLINQC